MPKLKNKSSAKKRFKITKNGKVIAKHAYKAHNASGTSSRQRRVLRKQFNLFEGDARLVKRNHLRVKIKKAG